MGCGGDGFRPIHAGTETSVVGAQRELTSPKCLRNQSQGLCSAVSGGAYVAKGLPG